MVTDGDGPVDGPSSSKAKWWVDVEVSPSPSGVNGLIGDCLGSSQTQSFDRSVSEKPCSLACPISCNGSNFEAEFFKFWEKEDSQKQQMEFHQPVTDRALVEEASWVCSESVGVKGFGVLFSHFSFFLSDSGGGVL